MYSEAYHPSLSPTYFWAHAGVTPRFYKLFKYLPKLALKRIDPEIRFAEEDIFTQEPEIWNPGMLQLSIKGELLVNVIAKEGFITFAAANYSNDTGSFIDGSVNYPGKIINVEYSQEWLAETTSRIAEFLTLRLLYLQPEGYKQAVHALKKHIIPNVQQNRINVSSCGMMA